jgi:hypothetical protein
VHSCYGAFLPRPGGPGNVCGISPGFPRLSPTQGQVAHVLRTRSPLPRDPKAPEAFDLHVLSAPPAFVLSQDQTLQRVDIALPGGRPRKAHPLESFTLLPHCGHPGEVTLQDPGGRETEPPSEEGGTAHPNQSHPSTRVFKHAVRGERRLLYPLDERAGSVTRPPLNSPSI